MTWQRWRDAAISTVALGLIVFEATLYTGPPRLPLLTLYAGMLGLPGFLRLGDRQPHPEDERRSV